MQDTGYWILDTGYWKQPAYLIAFILVSYNPVSGIK
jgi:hypothetical protein